MSRTFEYIACTAQGQEVRGSIRASDEAEAVRLLGQQQLTPLDIQAPAENSGKRMPRLTMQDKLTALFELAAMLQAGVGSADAVASQAQAAAHPAMRKAFASMSKSLRHGGSFAQALAEVDLKLPVYVDYLVRAGELSGTVGTALQDACDQLEYDLQVRAEAKGALIYPTILVLSGIAAVSMMFMFVVPSFVNLLDQPASLPWLAWAVLSAGRWANNNQMLVVLLLALAVIGPILLLRMERVRVWLLGKLEGVPVIGDWLVQADIAAWARVMAALTRNRVELTVALDLARAVVRTPKRQFRMRRARNAVIQGSTLAQALQDEGCLNDTGYNLVRVGEKTGALDGMLLALSSLYSKQGQQRMKKVLLMIEPIAILVIGSAIGTLIIAIILAITSANEIAF